MLLFPGFNNSLKCDHKIKLLQSSQIQRQTDSVIENCNASNISLQYCNQSSLYCIFISFYFAIHSKLAFQPWSTGTTVQFLCRHLRIRSGFRLLPFFKLPLKTSSNNLQYVFIWCHCFWPLQQYSLLPWSIYFDNSQYTF